MALDISRYVDITSGVGAGATVARRDLILRLFTDNTLLPPGTFLEFTSAAAVGVYFSTTSEEYLRAVYYFGWVSKNITRPQKISYARWVSASSAPRIYGQVKTQVLGTYTAITNGSFGMTIGSDVNTFTALDFSGASDLAGVAAVLQTAIRTKTGTQWTAATVTYNAVRGSFDFVGGSAVATSVFSVQQGVGGTPIAITLGWLPAATLVNGVYVDGAIMSKGALAEDTDDALTASAAVSNNFGSFVFMADITLDQAISAANWNKTQNVRYMFNVATTLALYSTWSNTSTGLGAIGGTSLTISETANEFPEQFPSMIEAATNYSAANSVQNYEFQMSALTPSVSTDSVANGLDAARVNYYGSTQTAGQIINFYQRGVLFGLPTDPLDMNVYANEQWLKDAAEAAILTLLLSLAKVSANTQGRSQILTTLQSVIDEALNNGTISVGKTLTTTQKLYISEITGDSNAWQQVQTIGYWVDCVIVASGSPLEYTAVYTLVYSKDDIIRKVEGRNVLI